MALLVVLLAKGSFCIGKFPSPLGYAKLPQCPRFDLPALSLARQFPPRRHELGHALLTLPASPGNSSFRPKYYGRQTKLLFYAFFPLFAGSSRRVFLCVSPSFFVLHPAGLILILQHCLLLPTSVSHSNPRFSPDHATPVHDVCLLLWRLSRLFACRSTPFRLFQHSGLFLPLQPFSIILSYVSFFDFHARFSRLLLCYD